MAIASGTGSGRRRPPSRASDATEGSSSIRVAPSRTRAQVEAAEVRTAAVVRARAASAGEILRPTCGVTTVSSSARTSGT